MYVQQSFGIEVFTTTLTIAQVDHSNFVIVQREIGKKSCTVLCCVLGNSLFSLVSFSRLPRFRNRRSTKLDGPKICVEEEDKVSYIGTSSFMYLQWKPTITISINIANFTGMIVVKFLCLMVNNMWNTTRNMIQSILFPNLAHSLVNYSRGLLFTSVRSEAFTKSTH